MVTGIMKAVLLALYLLGLTDRLKGRSQECNCWGTAGLWSSKFHAKDEQHACSNCNHCGNNCVLDNCCAFDSDLSDECYNLVEVEDPDSNTPKEEYEDNGKCTTSEKREKRKTIKIMYTLAGTFTGIFTVY